MFLGVGRYGTATLADVTVHPNGTLEPLRSYQGLGSLILHPMPKLDIYMYAGGEYDQRTAYTTTRVIKAGTPPTIQTLGVGYGSPLQSNLGCFTEVIPTNQNTPGVLPTATCQQDIRNIIEGTLGFWYRFYQGDRGRFQFGLQYSYAVRNLWSGCTTAATCVPGSTVKGVGPAGLESMFFTSMRYYLP